MADDIDNTLPERMELSALIKTFCFGEEKKTRRLFYRLAERDIKTGKLIAEGFPFLVRSEDLKNWLKQNRLRLEAEKLHKTMEKAAKNLRKRLANDASDVAIAPDKNQLIQHDERSKKIIDRRIAAIMETVKTLGYDPVNIPYGGKRTIESACKEKYPDLRFTRDAFLKAWQKAPVRYTG